ncbi:MAG: hypothetical protein JSS33_01655, partial [Proteobacteria bacterium]|nr:hypothetical protein [Pseudomonadota bacterium]
MYLRPSIIFVSLFAAAMAGCATLGADHEFSRDIASSSTRTAQLPASKINDEAPIKIDTDDKSHKATEAKIEPGSGQFINEAIAREPV